MFPFIFTKIIYIILMYNKSFLNLTIYPHRSLSKKGFKLLMFFVTFICLGCGLVFWKLGAWPVFGFLGLDILLIYLAFKINYSRGKMYENLRIVSKNLRISRCFPTGKLQVWNLNPYWTEVEIVKQNNHVNLLIRSEDKVVSVGSFLNNFDKKKLLITLEKSLKSYKKSLGV